MGSVAGKDPILSQLEWKAVSDALADASNCGCGNRERPRLTSRLYRAVTGSQGPHPLADPKLEAVRNFVCETNRTRRVAKHHVPALLNHGFNDRQVDALALLSA